MPGPAAPLLAAMLAQVVSQKAQSLGQSASNPNEMLTKLIARRLEPGKHHGNPDAAGALTNVAKSAMGLAPILGSLAKKGLELSKSQDEHNKRLQDLNPLLGAAAARSEHANLMRDQNSAQKVAGTSVMLSRSLDRFRDSTAPFSDSLDNFSNVIGAGFIDALTAHTEALRKFLEIFGIKFADPIKRGPMWEEEIKRFIKDYTEKNTPPPTRRD